MSWLLCELYLTKNFIYNFNKYLITIGIEKQCKPVDYIAITYCGRQACLAELNFPTTMNPCTIMYIWSGTTFPARIDCNSLYRYIKRSIAKLKHPLWAWTCPVGWACWAGAANPWTRLKSPWTIWLVFCSDLTLIVQMRRMATIARNFIFNFVIYPVYIFN